ncbi:hypothetical protein [Mailhella massiliensis]|uniref:hypothetical protein n=1 Tax=Mailhella massiliensis TaxID=1903261 RepID=UPI00097DE009|nr:hypothetical protein [Mailhella massiliensis]
MEHYHLEKRKYFEYKGYKGHYALMVTADWQVVLADLCPPSDGWGGHEPVTFAHPVYPVLASMVYRWAVREFLNWLYACRPPSFWFSTDGQENRRALYMRYAFKLEERGYVCYASDDDRFYFVRRAD